MTVWERMRAQGAQDRGYSLGYHDAREQYAHRLAFKHAREHTARVWAWVWGVCFWGLVALLVGCNL